MGRPSAATWRFGLITALAGLGLAAFAYLAAERVWRSVVHYVSPFHFADGDAVAGPRVTHHVVLVVVDGLRLERSRQLKTLNVLRARGADFDCTTSVPSYSRPGRANLATGAWPTVHGVTSNRHKEILGADNLFRAARRMGESVALAGSTIWPTLFGPDLEGALVLPTPTDARRLPASRATDAELRARRRPAPRVERCPPGGPGPRCAGLRGPRVRRPLARSTSAPPSKPTGPSGCWPTT